MMLNRWCAGCAAALLLVMVAGGAARPATRAQEATPAAGAANAPLIEMLAQAPDVLTGENAAQLQVAAYADIAAQSAAAGRPKPAAVTDEPFVRWANGLFAVAVPEPFISMALAADWKTLLGFDILDIDQALEIGEPPYRITMVRGALDRVAVETAWNDQGYQLLDVDGTTVASLNEEAEFDFTTEIGRYALARFNNAAFLADGTLVYTPTLALMRETLDAAAGASPSLGDRVDVAATVNAVERPLASALVMTGAALAGSPVDVGELAEGTVEPGPIETRIAELGQMPPIAMALLGVTPGGPLPQPIEPPATPEPEIVAATFQVALLMLDAGSAETAIRVAGERLATMTSIATEQPYTDYYASLTGRVAAEAPVAVMEIAFAPSVQPVMWLRMLFYRDLQFLAW